MDTFNMTRIVKIIIFTCIFCGLCALPSMGETVTRTEASRFARIFFNKAFGTDEVRPEFVYSGRSLTTDRLFSPFYVFNRKDGGYVIISAENKAFPVLGFSREGKFEWKNLNGAERERLAEFAHDIEIVRYDPRMPVKAVEAWTEFPQYSEKLLGYGHKEMLMPSATEFAYAPAQENDGPESEVAFPEPFTFHEEFVAATVAAESNREKMLDEILNPPEPQITQGSADSFQIRFPEEIVEGKIYNLQGGIVDMMTVKNSDTVVVKLNREMPGFYVAMFHGKSGKPYGVKLYKSK